MAEVNITGQQVWGRVEWNEDQSVVDSDRLIYPPSDRLSWLERHLIFSALVASQTSSSLIVESAPGDVVRITVINDIIPFSSFHFPQMGPEKSSWGRCSGLSSRTYPEA
ncbi:uncharacterized protein MCYG_07154 [Microsporum canis CBS 113480]|uniref:Uncharacterized protein n=1 Tax=Arthroderma otae (strain ATCC MYA-4605 / CBS 113480) TaxID=554155 RepID=C5FWQ1_ARTOC|nr:uncharacterized protein MCYG_07154 [Microsporum canis CBS 113480]EEQ34335.1 predicted protein [Microsporum canis CBS 113480]